MFFNKKLFAHENDLRGGDGLVRGAGRRPRTRCCGWADDPGRKGDTIHRVSQQCEVATRRSPGVRRCALGSSTRRFTAGGYGSWCTFKEFKGMTTATSGVIDRFPLLLPVRNPAVGYGASAVTRTPDRGHVAEVKNQCHRGGGVSIRVSKETFLPLNVQPVFSF